MGGDDASAGGKNPATGQSNDGSCGGLNPIDKKSADKPGAFDYYTYVDSGEKAKIFVT